ncbi:MAG: glycosyltransferase, partial [Myxococcota bacterium]
AQLASVIASRPVDEKNLVSIVDSDVDLSQFDFNVLGDLLEAHPEIGAVWAPPIDDGEVVSFGDRASHATLNGSFHAFPLLAGISPESLVGKTFALRRETLDEVGGFASLIDFLGEDMELANRLRSKGFEVRPAPIPTRSTCSERSFSSVVSRIARWMTVIRAQRPLLMVTYPVFFFGASLIVPAGTLLGTFAHGAIAALGSSLALSAMLTRVGLVIVARGRAGQRTSILSAVIDAILGDLVVIAGFLRASKSRKFLWRGVPLAIDRSGRLVATK